MKELVHYILNSKVCILIGIGLMLIYGVVLPEIRSERDRKSRDRK